MFPIGALVINQVVRSFLLQTCKVFISKTWKTNFERASKIKRLHNAWQTFPLLPLHSFLYVTVPSSARPLPNWGYKSIYMSSKFFVVHLYSYKLLCDCVLKLKIGVLKLFCLPLTVNTSLSHFTALSLPVHI